MSFSYYIGDAGDPRLEQLSCSSPPLGPELPDGLAVFWDICNRPDLQRFDTWTYLLRLSREELEQLLTNVYGEGWGSSPPEPPDSPATIDAWQAARAADLARVREYLQSVPPGTMLVVVAIDNS